MAENILTVLGIQSREDCISNMLAFAFNASQTFRYEFIRQICGKDPNKYTSAMAFTRVSAGINGIPDIVIALEKQSSADIIVIENKLKAEEGEDQTERYSSKEAIATLAGRLLPGRRIGKPSFVFLTLFSDQNPKAKNYAVHRHSELKQVAESITDWGSKLAKQLVNDWLVLIESFYEKENVAASDVFHDRLTDDSGLDGGYLYFRQALGQLNLPNSLTYDYFFRSSQQGRHYYGAVISKELWHPAGMEEVSGSWNLDPFTHYNIHLEPQYNVLSGGFNCFLHYEVNPYKPVKWVKKHISPEQYSTYLDRRATFTSILQAQPLPGWSFGGGSNQIAKTTFDFSKSSYAMVGSTLEEKIEEIAQAIDGVLMDI